MKKKYFIQESTGLPLMLKVHLGRPPKAMNPDRYEFGGQLYRLEELKNLGVKPAGRKSFDTEE